MTDFPDDPIEFQQAWSQVAGRLSGVREAEKLLNDRAANLFISRKDDAAEQLREMATILNRTASALSRDLDAYIGEARKRTYELRLAQPGHPGVRGPQ